MTYTEQELETYNDYMNFIRECIKDQCLNKFGLLIEDEQITIGHIKPDCNGRWSFYYDIFNNYKTQPDVWNCAFKRSCMGKFMSYDNWKLILIKENRDKRIVKLLEGLDKPEKEKLGL